MRTIVHTYETERICKFRIGIAEFNGKLRKIDGLEPEEYKEEIIRCRDCKFFDPVTEGGYCTEMRDEDGDPVYVGGGNGFCAWAERVD